MNNRQNLLMLITIPVVVMFSAVIGTLFGALGGWIVGLFYTNTIHTVLLAFGFNTVQVWQLGAFFGFVGGYFRAVTMEKKS